MPDEKELRDYIDKQLTEMIDAGTMPDAYTALDEEYEDSILNGPTTGILQNPYGPA